MAYVVKVYIKNITEIKLSVLHLLYSFIAFQSQLSEGVLPLVQQPGSYWEWDTGTGSQHLLCWSQTHAEVTVYDWISNLLTH